MIAPMKSTGRPVHHHRASLTALVALMLGLTVLAGASSPVAVAAEPKGKIDCSKYTGTEKEACEKMMARRRS